MKPDEKDLREPGSYVTGTVAGMPIVAVRDEAGTLRAFYNVCKHRAHELLSGSGVRRGIVCPYHAWNFDLTGRLRRARNTGGMPGFDASAVCLDQVGITEFGGMVYVNLDPEAAPLAEQAGSLEAEIETWAPDVAKLTLARRLTYDIASNWKNVVDNVLECYHCHVAHKDFVSLVDMSTYKVTTYGIYSSHMAQAGKTENSAYDVSDATVTEQQHPVHRRGSPGGGHRPGGERPARDAHPRVHPGEDRLRPRRVRVVGARGPSLPRPRPRRVPKRTRTRPLVTR
nr:aromatic ring-hydroxylating dioxygenase subunit alpha [Microbispora sp. H10670]